MVRMRTTASLLLVLAAACSPAADNAQASDATANPAGGQAAGGQAAVDDSTSTPNVVRVALKSADHTTLVKALQAANLVDPLANPGPFTVFAPTNAAFDKLPAGTVASLLEAANISKLKDILQHHVTTSALDVDALSDGMELGMVTGGAERITRKDGATWVGNAKIIASVHASNGWVHVIDAVLVPASK